MLEDVRCVGRVVARRGQGGLAVGRVLELNADVFHRSMLATEAAIRVSEAHVRFSCASASVRRQPVSRVRGHFEVLRCAYWPVVSRRCAREESQEIRFGKSLAITHLDRLTEWARSQKPADTCLAWFSRGLQLCRPAQFVPTRRHRGGKMVRCDVPRWRNWYTQGT